MLELQEDTDVSPEKVGVPTTDGVGGCEHGLVDALLGVTAPLGGPAFDMIVLNL